MRAFEFRIDEQSEEFVRSIVHEMIAIFGISEDEAVVRINARFVGQTLTGDDIIFHEEAGFWARDIMYGPESFWWNDEAAAKVIPLSALPQSIYRPGRDRVDPDEHRED